MLLKIKNSTASNEPLKFIDSLLLLHIKHSVSVARSTNMYSKLKYTQVQGMPQSFMLWLTQQNIDVHFISFPSAFITLGILTTRST